jgi:hypothetical protein
LTALAFLFLKTLRETRSEPYTIRREYLHNWVIAPGAPGDSLGASLALRPRPELSMNLSRQVFQRTMESSVSPSEPGIPLVLRSELDGVPAGRVSPEQLAAVAAQTGLASATLEPICLGARRTSGAGPRQIFFVVFEFPAFERFRHEVARLIGSNDGQHVAFDPAALSPILIVSASDGDFRAWLPLKAERVGDCVAPVEPE